MPANSACPCAICQTAPEPPAPEPSEADNVEPAPAPVSDGEPDTAPLDRPTFGFELEFGRNCRPLAAELHERGLVGDDTIHGWHCDCSTCEDDDFDLKVQSDSTADGEVISRVFTSTDEATAVMRELQAAAVKVDAEPNMSTGLHVHIARPNNGIKRARGLLAFLLWEGALRKLARGRFTQHRNMNTRVLDTAINYLERTGDVDYRNGDVQAQALRVLAELAKECKDTPRPQLARDLYLNHRDADRHSNLSVRTRFNTWEFRIWNATRSAWRMELAVRMALAWYDEDFVNRLLSYDADLRTPEALRDIVAQDWQRDDRLAALIDRQVEYLPLAASAPREFLVA